MIHFGKWLGAAAIAVAGTTTIANAASSASPLGHWQLSSGESRFHIAACGEGQLCAKLTWLDAEARQDENLAAYLDTYVMQGATPSAPNTWSGTVTYDGDTYNGKLVLVDEDTMTLQGCVGIFCKSMELARL